MSGWYRISRAGAGRMVSPLQRMVAATVMELLLGHTDRRRTLVCFTTFLTIFPGVKGKPSYLI